MRENKAEEEEQLLLARYRSVAATKEKEEEGDWREEGDDGTGMDKGEEVRGATTLW